MGKRKNIRGIEAEVEGAGNVSWEEWGIGEAEKLHIESSNVQWAIENKHKKAPTIDIVDMGTGTNGYRVIIMDFIYYALFAIP